MAPAVRFERPWFARLSVVWARAGGAGFFKADHWAADCGSWGCGSEVRLGHPPQGSADQARHPLEGEAQDSPMRPGARQVQHDPGLQRDDAGGEFDQAQVEGVELRHALA